MRYRWLVYIILLTLLSLFWATQGVEWLVFIPLNILASWWCWIRFRESIL